MAWAQPYALRAPGDRWPVTALGAGGQNTLMSPFGTRVLYELVPQR
jgi:hypothetical protein